jgi:hypothetical protein
MTAVLASMNQQRRPTGPPPVQRSPHPDTIAQVITIRTGDLHLAAGLVMGFAIGSSVSMLFAVLSVATVLR